MTATCLDNEFNFQGGITMFIPWGDCGGMMPHWTTGLPKAAKVLAIHFLEQPFIQTGEGDAGLNPMP